MYCYHDLWFIEKRFHFPGNKRVSETEMEQPAINFTNAHTGSKIKTQRFDGIKYMYSLR